ncbi:Rne/Rng family ribonuclease [Pseudarthrobacter sp. J1763]|uniref:Rne/Rng family ribonuclease n=1 Tax=Pseudarthrobacter sp. J1763 TaxID=3420445 RepID=UPI003D2758E1
MDSDQITTGNDESTSAPQQNTNADTNESAKAPAKRPTRSRRKPAAAATSTSEADASEAIDATPAAVTNAAEATAEPAPKRTRKAPVRRTRKAAAPGESAAQPTTEAAPVEPVQVESSTSEAATAAPARRTRTTKMKAQPAASRQRASRAAATVEAAAPEVSEPEASAAVVEAPVVEAPVSDATVSETPVAEATTRGASRRNSGRNTSRNSRSKKPVTDEAASHPAEEPQLTEETQPAGTATPEVKEAAPSVTTEDGAVPAEEKPAPSITSLFMEPVSASSVIFQAPDLSVVVRTPAEVSADIDEAEDLDEEEGDAGSRRRRRSRSRRNRSRGGSRNESSENPDTDESEDPNEEEVEPDNDSNNDGVTSRRRRRRRRGDQDLELTGGGDDDPPNTVTRVRAPRAVTESAPSNRVTSVKGSTRLEAKKQRRRESRETGRRRQVITEAEFLARRESVDRQMIVRQRDDRIQIGVLEDGVLAEHFVSKTQQDSLIGNVYLGRVQNVLPSMEAAFVDIGRGRNAVLYAGEVNWDSVHLEGKARRIENALKSGDSVLVQVSKDPVGHKGARLTSQISLPGRYLVYVPGGSMTGISRKLPDVERNRLKRILKDRLPENAGVIVRTAAEGASEEELTHDINRLRAQWEGIESQATSTKILAPELLYGEPDLTIKVVRDVFNEDFSKLIVSGEEAWDTIEAYVTYVAPDLVGRLEKWTEDRDIFSAWRIDEQIHKALDRKVFLPSGGSLVIDRTEAMTVVDVNTGKFTGSGGNLEETVTKNNLEAAEEVVRQLRLRDIGGIIVIDFIDMVLESNRDLVLRRMVECLGRDRTKHQVAEVTSLGLVQMTRKRMGTGLLEVFGEQCEVCDGRGVVTHDEPVEHRRSSTSSADHQHRDHSREAQRDQNREQNRDQSRSENQQPSVRSERRRRRGKGGNVAGEQQQQQQLELIPANPVAVEEEFDEDRQAKAEAVRHALANIAAAAHAAHAHNEDAHNDDTQSADAHNADAHSADADESDATAATQATSAEKGTEAVENEGAARAVLRFDGEEVVIPVATSTAAAVSAAPALSLDVLNAAFATLGGNDSAATEPADVEAATDEPATAVAAPVGSSTSRGRRRRSASRAQGAALETNVELQSNVAPASSGTHEAKAPEAQELTKSVQAPAKQAPVILGVGVPASEL